MIKILALAIGVLSLNAFAHDKCEVSQDHALTLNDNKLIITKDNNQFTIDARDQFYINDEKVELSKEQQQWVSEYKAGYNRFIKDVSVIAIDAAEFGISVANEALGKVFGESNDDVQALNEKLKEIKENLVTSLKQNQVWNEQQIEKIFDHEFAQEIDAAAEALANKVENNVFKLLSFSFWSNLSNLESRMEAFEQDIEERAATFEKAIESKTDQLEQTIRSLDVLEQQLSQSHEKLAAFDVFKDCELNTMI